MRHPAGMDAVSARYAFVDVETTGFSPITCAVVEVACLVVDHGEVVATFETLVDPQQPIPPYVTAIHGITDQDVASKPALANVAPFVASLCDGAIVVAHNAGFDLGFLPFLQKYPSLCSYRLAYRVVPEAPNHRNQTLGDFFQVSDPILESRSAHRALADAIVTRHVFFACLKRYLRAGLPSDVRSLIAFTRRHPQLCRYEQRVSCHAELAPCHPELVPCHAEQCACAERRRSIEAPPSSRFSTAHTVSTTSTPKFHFR